jgi:hypothetical protein
VPVSNDKKQLGTLGGVVTAILKSHASHPDCLFQGDFESGNGTHLNDTFICASVIGVKRVLQATEEGKVRGHLCMHWHSLR